MSWIVQTLLNNKNLIKSRARIGDQSEIFLDDYTDLLLVEKAIDELKEKGLLGGVDEFVIDLVGEGRTIGAAIRSAKLVSYNIGKDNPLVKRYNDVCNRIALYLGGYFTDDGYVAYMQRKYSLSDEQVSEMLEYMKSRYKHMIKRKQIKNVEHISEEM